jgi:hypothetical protein
MKVDIILSKRYKIVDFCCKVFEDAYNKKLIEFNDNTNQFSIGNYVILFCPWCSSVTNEEMYNEAKTCNRYSKKELLDNLYIGVLNKFDIPV